MFGMSLTGEETAADVRANPYGPASLTSDLAEIADSENLAFLDDDVNLVVIYDSA